MRAEAPAAQELDQFPETAEGGSNWRGLRGLLIAQIFGQFNDQAWKQIVILLMMAAVASEPEKQSAHRRRHDDAFDPAGACFRCLRGSLPTA